MAGWETALTWSILQAVLFTVQGLQVTMTRSPGSFNCGRLQCWNDVTADGNIFTTTGITVYDVTEPTSKIKLASISSNNDGLFIDQTKINDINGTGSVSRYHADLTLDFHNQTDCTYGSFECELEFVNTKGQSDSITGTATPGNLSSGCNCAAIIRQMNDLITQSEMAKLELAALRQANTVLTNDFSVLKQNYNLLQTDFSHLVTQFTTLQNFLNITYVVVTTPTPPAQVSCYRGMPHINAREKFVLWGTIPALCDTETDSGGWVVIQRRTTGDVDFYRDWDDYKKGFGTPDTDFWIGNDIIHNLTSQGYNELRVDMEYEGRRYYAHYSQFHVSSEITGYQLAVSGYTGNAGDSLTASGVGVTAKYVHDGMLFSTFDMDHDKGTDNCAQKYTGAWWYNNCYYSNLNGVWGRNDIGGIIWWGLGGAKSLTFVEMKVRHI